MELRVDWSKEEVELIVADYLRMLTLELTHQTFNKTKSRKALQQKLNGRSDKSIEFKHCNISAVMHLLGAPSIRGYRPLANYQLLLAEVVADQLKKHPLLNVAAAAAVDAPAAVAPIDVFQAVEAKAPKISKKTAEPQFTPTFRAVKRDYLEREAINRSLGLAGEEFVVRFEQWRLQKAGQSKLAGRVEHVSVSRGDGLGYDVLSFEENGHERFIEVKTTSFGKETPFFVSRGEIALSDKAQGQFRLYRLYNFRTAPKFFSLSGPLSLQCKLDAVTYKASFS
jgi:hypothetical protein